MKAPPRLRDDPAVTPELRDDLERTAAAQYRYDAAAGLAGLQAAIAALPGAGAGGAASSAAGSAPGGAAMTSTAGGATSAAGNAAGSGALGASATAVKTSALLGSVGGKLALAAGGAAVIAASAIAWPRATPERTTDRAARELNASAAARVPEQPRAVSPPATAAPATVPAAPEPAAAPVPETTDPIDAQLARMRAGLARSGEDRAQAALRREIEQLGRIKALLARDPARAYRLAEAGHRAHPGGMLRHEREGLAVLALWKLQRNAQAEARTRAFVARYPASPLRGELEREQAAHAGAAQEPR